MKKMYARKLRTKMSYDQIKTHKSREYYTLLRNYCYHYLKKNLNTNQHKQILISGNTDLLYSLYWAIIGVQKSDFHKSVMA